MRLFYWGTGRCLLGESWKPIDCDSYREGVLPDLSACSETHLQLPLKLNIVGKKLCEV